VSYKNLQVSDEMRRQVVIDIFNTNDTIKNTCAKWGIDQNTYYQWRNRFVAQGKTKLKRKQGRPMT